MVYALDPAELDGDMAATPESPAPEPIIDVLGDLWRFNPRHVFTTGDQEMVRLWAMAGGLDGLRMLPEAGGLLDQAAIMVDAFAIMSSAAGDWRELKKGRQ